MGNAHKQGTWAMKEFRGRCQRQELLACLKATHMSELGPRGEEAGVANARNHRRYSRQRQATNGALKRSSRALPTPGTIGVSLGNATQANLAQENEMHVANSKL